MKVKTVKNLKWRSAGEEHTVQLMVVKPLGYRLNKNSKILYREPAYFICTDNDRSAQALVQDYLWRWEIEVNIGEEKTVLGCYVGKEIEVLLYDKQVRKEWDQNF